MEIFSRQNKLKIIAGFLVGVVLIAGDAKVGSTADLYNDGFRELNRPSVGDNEIADVGTGRTEYTELTDSVVNASLLLSKLIKKSKEEKEQELQKIIKEEGYDYDLTMQSFYDNTSPYSDIDYEELVAACCAIMKNSDVNVAELNFMNMSVKDKTIEEYQAKKIKKYAEIKKGKYVFEGYTYLTSPKKITRYKKIGKFFIKAGKQKIVPRKINTKYGIVKLKTVEPKDLLNQVMSNDKECKEEYMRILAQIREDDTCSKDALTQTVLIKTPGNLVNAGNVTIDAPDDKTKDIMKRALNGAKGNRKVILETAFALLGKVPYLWGGKPDKPGYDNSWWTFNSAGKQKGLDCSGYVQWVYMTAGYDKSVTNRLYSTRSISAENKIEKEELQIGDLGLFNNGGASNHVGIYLGDGYFIHCSSSKDTVVISQPNFKVFRRIKEIDTAIINPTKVVVSKPISNTDDDVMLLAKTIWHEARGEGMNGWIAVGEVIVNRVEDNRFPDNIRDVIYAPRQFSYNKEIEYMNPSTECVDIARQILNGQLRLFNNKNVLFFRNPGSITNNSDWGRYRYYRRINHHVFYLGD